MYVVARVKPVTTDVPCKGHNLRQTETCVGISVVSVYTSQCLQLLLGLPLHSWARERSTLGLYRLQIVILEVEGVGPLCT